MGQMPPTDIDYPLRSNFQGGGGGGFISIKQQTTQQTEDFDDMAQVRQDINPRNAGGEPLWSQQMLMQHQQQYMKANGYVPVGAYSKSRDGGYRNIPTRNDLASISDQSPTSSSNKYGGNVSHLVQPGIMTGGDFSSHVSSVVH